jgi:hypothetical protein
MKKAIQLLVTICLFLLTLQVSFSQVYLVNPCTYSPIAGSGTSLPNCDDCMSGMIPIGFTFNFYGVNYTQCDVSSNGFLTFNGGLGSGCCSGQVIPTAAYPTLISWSWDDMYTSGAIVNYFTTGIAPNRIFVINYNNVGYCCTSNNIASVQIQLYETSNEIRILSANNIHSGRTATMGIQSFGVGNTVVSGRNAAGWDASINECLSFAALPSEIEVVGNGNIILDGSTSPSLTNNTQFGTSGTCSTSVVKTFVINNSGLGTLAISGINFTGPASADFTVIPPIPVSVAPGGSSSFQVAFDPTAVGIRSATLNILNSDADESTYNFDLEGTGVANDVIPPVFTSCPGTISANNAPGTCGAAVTFTAPNVTDNCSTLGDNSLSLVLSRFNTNYTTIASNIPNPVVFNMDGGSNNISDGCSDMYDGGNFLNTNIAGGINYSDNSVISSTAFGSTGQYFTRYISSGAQCQNLPSMFIMAANLNNVTDFTITGNIGADGSGNVDIAQFNVTSNGVLYNVFVKRIYNAFDPSVNEVFIIPNNPSASQNINFNTDDNYHNLTNIASSTRVYYLLYAGMTGSYINNASTTNIVQSFLDNVTQGNTGLTLVQTAGPVSGSTFPVGSTPVTYTATDASSNSTTCTFNVTVNDIQNPTASNPANIVLSGCNGSFPAPDVTVVTTEADNCGTPSVTFISDGAPSLVGCTETTIRTYRVADASLNFINVTQNLIRTVDITNPTASNPATIVLSGCNGTYPAPNPNVVTDEADACGTPVVVFVSQGAPSMAGCTETIIRTYSVTDACGNNINVTQMLQRTVDTTPPSIPALPGPSNISCPSSPSFTIPNATDGCGTPSLTFNDVTTPTCGNSYSTTRTWTATDACGNSSVASQTINVVDNTAPVITCGGPILLSGCVPATYTATPPPASDACGGTITFNNDHPGTSYPAGNTTIIWTATDACGNSSTCSQVITVTSPEADITGNGYAITHTSSIISLANWTDFGNVNVCTGLVTRTYMIRNSGAGPLNLTGVPKVQLSGLNAADYSVVQPAVGSLAAGASTSFQVTFNPSATGFRNARITVPNNDCNEAGYYYAIRGNGTACGPMLVPDPSGQSQTSGNNTNEENGNSTMGIEDRTEFGALIYPNPSNGVFTLELSEAPGSGTEIKLLNSLGQVIYSSRLMVQTSYYDFSYLSAGTYFIQVINPENNFTKTILITQKY